MMFTMMRWFVGDIKKKEKIIKLPTCVFNQDDEHVKSVQIKFAVSDVKPENNYHKGQDYTDHQILSSEDHELNYILKKYILPQSPKNRNILHSIIKRFNFKLRNDLYVFLDKNIKYFFKEKK